MIDAKLESDTVKINFFYGLMEELGPLLETCKEAESVVEKVAEPKEEN